LKVNTNQTDVRTAILDAAERSLAKKGYKKMTIDDLASEVGIGKGSVYLHFESKEDIALSHIDRIVERLHKKLLKIARSNAASDLKLHQMLVSRVLHRLDSISGYSKSLSEVLSAIRPALFQRRIGYFTDEAEIFGAVIDRGKADGVFLTKMSTPDIASSLIIATNSLLPMNLSPLELGSRKDVERRVSKIADLLIAGVCSE